MGNGKWQIRHMIWDWNGTLLDDAKACAAAVDTLMDRRGMLGETIDGYRGRVMFPVRDYYRKAGFDLEREDYGALCDEFGDAYGAAVLADLPEGHRHAGLPPTGIHHDAVQVLTEAGRLGVTHAIVSASEFGALRQQVETFGLSAFFQELVGRDDNHAGTKTHLVQAWVERCGYRRDQILYIGDTEHDCEAALASGIRVALVSDGHVEVSRLLPCRVPVFPNRHALWQSVAPLTDRPVFRTLRFETPIGEMGVTTDNLGVVHVDLPDQTEWNPPAGCLAGEPNECTIQARNALLSWFEHPDLLPGPALSILGTAFQREVWGAVSGIRTGETTSYGALALQIGRPGAARAVAQALRANPVPILIPCHRVLGSDGTPTGFMGKRKNPLQQRLLDLEKHAATCTRVDG